MPSAPTISIIIPAYNEATYIGRLLRSLEKQSYKDFEVIVSDADSKDGTKKLIESFKSKLDVKYLSSPPRGPANGRNEGAKLAIGDWLLFLDADDDIKDPEFVKTLITETIKNNWSTSSTKNKPLDPKMSEKLGLYINYKYIKLLAKTKHPVAPGWCIFTKRSIFEELNGFNEKIHFGEDYDYVSRAGKFGFGFTDKTHYLVDMRRGREEGINLTLKAIANEIYRHTHRYNLEKNPIKYEFGKHKKLNDKN